MKVLTIGDPHFKPNNVTNSEYLIRVVEELTARHTPDLIVILGDVLDTHERIEMGCLCRAVTLIETCAQCAPTYVLIGNHDRLNNSDFLSNTHPFTAFRTTKLPIRIVNTPVLSSFPSSEGEYEYNFVFVPYVPPGRLHEAISEVCTTEVLQCEITAVFAHQEIRGCNLGGSTSAVGDEWREDYPLLISGHIHTYHRVGKNVIYPGTPFQHNYGDPENKGVSLFTFTPNQIKELRIPLKGSRKKKIVNMKATDSPDNLDESISDEKVKFVVNGTKEEIAGFIKSKRGEKLKQEGHTVVFHTIRSESNTSGDPSPNTIANYATALRQRAFSIGGENLREIYDEIFKNDSRN